MPLNAIGEAILQPIFEIVVQVIGYYTSRVIVPIFTLGAVRVEPGPQEEMVAPKFGRIQCLNSRLIMDAELGSLIGIIFWLIAVIGFGYYINNA